MVWAVQANLFDVCPVTCLWYRTTNYSVFIFLICSICALHIEVIFARFSMWNFISLRMNFNGYTEFLGKHHLNFLSCQIYSFIGCNLIAKFFNTFVQEQSCTACVISPVEQLPSILVYIYSAWPWLCMHLAIFVSHWGWSIWQWVHDQRVKMTRLSPCARKENDLSEKLLMEDVLLQLLISLIFSHLGTQDWLWENSWSLKCQQIRPCSHQHLPLRSFLPSGRNRWTFPHPFHIMLVTLSPQFHHLYLQDVSMWTIWKLGGAQWQLLRRSCLNL